MYIYPPYIKLKRFLFFLVFIIWNLGLDEICGIKDAIKKRDPAANAANQSAFEEKYVGGREE